MHLPPRDCFDHHALYWLSVSSGVRINQQGFTFYESPVLLKKHHRDNNNDYYCPRTLGALCSHGESYTFFRCTDTPLTIASDAPPPFRKLWEMEGCRGRIPTLDRFDVSMCDLRDGTVLVWADNRISVQYNMDLPYWPTLLICLIVVWLVINMGESVASILHVTNTNNNNNYYDDNENNNNNNNSSSSSSSRSCCSSSSYQGKITSALCVILVATVLIYTPMELWITDRERWMYIFTVCYILAYSAFHITNPHTINVIMGCLVLVTSRFYQHNDTPYAGGFLFCIAARFTQKVYVTNFSFFFSGEEEGDNNNDTTTLLLLYEYMRLGFMSLDVVFFVLLYMESLHNAFPDPMHGQLCLVGILFSAWVVGKLLGNYIVGCCCCNNNNNK